MKKIKKILVSLFVGIGIILPSVALADSSWNWEKETYIYGAALNDSQIKETADSLGINIDDVNRASVNGSDLKKYIGYDTADSNMISSVAVKKLKDGQGIKVNIKTPSNITEITEGQYTNAAITAGITNAEINVASPKQVTGESALVGVYKAVELNGDNLETDRTEVAQEELATLKEVTEENKDKENFDSDKLDKAVIDVKEKLADYKKENGTVASADQIKTYIEDSLNNVNMGDVLSNNNIQVIINYFQNYQNTSAIDSEEVKENLKKFGNDIAEGAKKIYDDNKDQIDSAVENAKESGLWDQIVNFFKSIVDGIANIFK